MHGVLAVVLILALASFPTAADQPTGGQKPTMKFHHPLPDEPGSMGFALEQVMPRLFPELKKPRPMTLGDVEDPIVQQEFLNGGYVFVLRGDFDGDRKADIALVGKHAGEELGNVFFAILSVRADTVTREFFMDRACDKYAALMVDHGLKPGKEAIAVHCSLGGDSCFYVYWDGRKYVPQRCFDEPAV